MVGAGGGLRGVGVAEKKGRGRRPRKRRPALRPRPLVFCPGSRRKAPCRHAATAVGRRPSSRPATCRQKREALNVDLGTPRLVRDVSHPAPVGGELRVGFVELRLEERDRLAIPEERQDVEVKSGFRVRGLVEEELAVRPATSRRRTRCSRCAGGLRRCPRRSKFSGRGRTYRRGARKR